MGKISIELGKTDGFGYIGIQPPLTDEQQELLQSMRFSLINPDNGPVHSQTGFTGGTDEEIRQKVVETGHQIAGLLSEAGHEVEIDDTIYSIGRGHHFFGGHFEYLG
jgi:hypothetical protein